MRGLEGNSGLPVAVATDPSCPPAVDVGGTLTATWLFDIEMRRCAVAVPSRSSIGEADTLVPATAAVAAETTLYTPGVAPTADSESAFISAESEVATEWRREAPASAAAVSAGARLLPSLDKRREADTKMVRGVPVAEVGAAAAAAAVVAAASTVKKSSTASAAAAAAALGEGIPPKDMEGTTVAAPNEVPADTTSEVKPRAERETGGEAFRINNVPRSSGWECCSV
jgi:hypothetical protein